MEGNAFYTYAQLVVGLVGAAPTTMCLQHTHRLLTRSFPDTALKTKLVLDAWAAVNDVIFRHEGFLPYEVFEEIAANYGDEMARLVVSFDNLFITGQQAQGFKARTRPLRDPVQLLVRSLAESRGQEDDRSLGQVLKWFNDRAASGTGPQQDFNDIDILTWWAQLVTRGSIMEESGPVAPLLNATFGFTFTTSKSGAPLQRSPRSQQQALLQAAAQQRQTQTQQVAGPDSGVAAPSPLLHCPEQLQLLPSDSDVMQVDEPGPPSRGPTPAPLSPAPTESSGGGGHSSPGSSTYGLSPGVTMLYELWLSREQKLPPAKVAALLQSIKTRLDVIWASADPEVSKVARSQTPKLLRELLETQGLRRLTGRAALDESWDFFLRFLDIKTQPLLTKGLRTLLSSTGGKAMAGRVGVVEQLLPEVAMRQRKPLGSVEELAGYVQVHQQELQALVELLHRGSGMYKTSLEELQLWLAQHQKEAQAVGGGRDAPRTQGPQ